MAQLCVCALLLFALLKPVYTNEGVCLLPFCKCAPTANPTWSSVNCTLEETQSLQLSLGSLSENVIELDIIGGDSVVFHYNAFTKLVDLGRVRVFQTRNIEVRRNAFSNLSSNSIVFEIADCDHIHVESKAFTQIKGPVTANISRCEYVQLDAEAFSWILHMSINDVPRLNLASKAFALENGVPNVGDHGAAMTIHLINVKAHEFKTNTFGSSAGEVKLERVKVEAVKRRAFSANTYNIFTLINSSLNAMESETFSPDTLIDNLEIKNCYIHTLPPATLQSAVTNMTIQHSKFGNVASGAINITVATVVITDNEFIYFNERGFELKSWNKMSVERNSFDELEPHAIYAPFSHNSEIHHKFTFIENELVDIKKDSLDFIGEISGKPGLEFIYENNYYAQICHCDIEKWLEGVFGNKSVDNYESESHCVVNDIFANCYKVSEGNMELNKFIQKVCSESPVIHCEPVVIKTDGVITEIKNTRFPNRKLNNDKNGISDRDRRIIGTVLITVAVCVFLALVASAIKFMKRKGYCLYVKNAAISSNHSCTYFCDRLCISTGLDNAGSSISRLSINEYTERTRLNEPRTDIETRIPEVYSEEIVPTEEKATQTLPEELTKELLDSLREKLDDPDNYTEAREMIEHLYELIKVEESCNSSSTNYVDAHDEDNIYDLPFPPTIPRKGKNHKQMMSIGTKVPSLDKLQPLSPYYRQTALSHEYFEPKDMTVHLYAEVTNNDKEKKRNVLSSVPDLVSEQPIARGPFLRAMRDKVSHSPIAPRLNPISMELFPKTSNTSTLKSNKSNASNSSSRMLNRPLPEKPFDPGEGTSCQDK